jgi:flagellar motor switch protein FliG
MMNENIGLNPGVVDGKAQVVEMLRMMPYKEKMKLISLISEKNPQLANEFKERGISIQQLEGLSDKKIIALITQIPPQIMGMALKNLVPALQKRVLKLCPKDYAESAYEVMISSFINQDIKTKSAQEKVIKLMLRF